RRRGAATQARESTFRVSIRYLAIVCALAGLAGCASVRPADTRLPVAYEAPAEAAADVDIAQWWTAFNDPPRTELVQEALARSPDARSAAARLEEARAQRSGALTRFLPQGALVGSGRKADSEVTDLKGASELPTDIPGFSLGGETENYGLNFDVS